MPKTRPPIRENSGRKQSAWPGPRAGRSRGPPKSLEGRRLAASRLQTDAATRCKNFECATAVIWKTLMAAQTRFRRLLAPELLAKVYVAVRYEDGIEVTGKEAAA